MKYQLKTTLILLGLYLFSLLFSLETRSTPNFVAGEDTVSQNTSIKSLYDPPPTGGIISVDGDFTIHSFNSIGTFNFTPQVSGSVEVLVIGGGGGGGGQGWPGGGGAGGYIYQNSYTITDQSYEVVVGSGGNNDQNGQESKFNDLIALGGGRGGGAGIAGDGGSGGGGIVSSGPGIGTSGQGYNGGAGIHNAGGGGGGAAGSGQAGHHYQTGGNGGAGIYTEITGTEVGRAGGGAGHGQAGYGSATCGGGYPGSNNGKSNTGAGGSAGGSGGSGVVIIRYLTESFGLTYDFATLSYTEDNLSMNDTTVLINSTARFHIVVKNFGPTTDNTPIKWICDGGIFNNGMNEITSELTNSETEHHIFSPVWTAPSTIGNYTLKVFTDHEIDGYRYNDTTEITITTIDALTNFPYTQDFEISTLPTSGGEITTHEEFTIHSFNTVGDSYFEAAKAGEIEVLIIAGGGGSGSLYWPGGGGAGGYLYFPSFTIAKSQYFVTVGNGGTMNGNGQDSQFENIISIGGGHGGGASGIAESGGSGGGGLKTGSGPASGITGQGHAGGPGMHNAGGGGGGAGSLGSTAVNYQTGGNGGTGVYSEITGENIGRGGGGAGNGNGGNGSACCGGGKVGQYNGLANTGGGGFGGGSGGSGTVIIRYLTSSQESEMTFPLWTESNVEGELGDWNQEATATSVPLNGSYVLAFNSGTCPLGNSTRLESPLLDFSEINNPSVSLDFYHETILPAANDKIQLQVFTEQNVWENVGIEILRYSDVPGWQDHTIDLTYLSGQKVKIGLLGIAGGGNDMKIDDVVIKDLALNIIANFTPDITSGYFPLNISFTDQSIGTPTVWNWDFENDGIIDNNTQNPTWTFDQPGLYSVKLSTGDGINSSTFVLPEAILVKDYDPIITSISDILDDQGKQVQIIWDKGFTDASYQQSNFYSIWRLDEECEKSNNKFLIKKILNDEALQNINPNIFINNQEVYWNSDGQIWTYIDMVPALMLPEYAIVAPTLFDNIGTNFKVVFHDLDDYYQSEPYSGFSVDNLAPETPGEIQGNMIGESFILQWEETSAPDFQHYAIYKLTENGKSESDPVIYTTETSYADYDLNYNTIQYFVTAIDLSGNESGHSEIIEISPPRHSFCIKMFLEGPYQETDMNSNLSNYLPLNHPYFSEPWNYSGEEFINTDSNGLIVDWILFELRETTGEAETAISDSIIAQKAVILLKDGSIVDTSLLNLPIFNIQVKNNLFVVLWHRNHLGIMSAIPVTESDGVYNYDFTLDESQTFGGLAAIKELVLGTWGMIGGDNDGNGIINASDKSNYWLFNAGKNGYLPSDLNLDGEVQNQDKIEVWLDNIGANTLIPD